MCLSVSTLTPKYCLSAPLYCFALSWQYFERLVLSPSILPYLSSSRSALITSSNSFENSSVLKNEAELVIEEISKIEVDTAPIYTDGCTVIKSEDSIKNKVVVIRADVFKPEYQIATMQLQLCTGGFGCEPNSRGSACFCTNLYSGKESRYERRDILGIIEKDKLPEWAKQRLDEVQKERTEKRKERDAR